MAWLALVVSGVFEAVWAVALGKSEGFSRLAPSLVFLVGLALSMGGLAYAMRSLPVGTAYAVWVGIGAALTVAFGILTGSEPVSLVKVALIVGLIGCVVGLKLPTDTTARPRQGRAPCGRCGRPQTSTRGAYMMTATPTRQMSAPEMS